MRNTISLLTLSRVSYIFGRQRRGWWIPIEGGIQVTIGRWLFSRGLDLYCEQPIESSRWTDHNCLYDSLESWVNTYLRSLLFATPCLENNRSCILWLHIPCLCRMSLTGNLIFAWPWSSSILELHGSAGCFPWYLVGPGSQPVCRPFEGASNAWVFLIVSAPTG